jgi:MFS family permease
MGIAGIGYGASLAVDLALVADVLPDPAEAGKDMAVFNMSRTLASALAPAIAPTILLLGADRTPPCSRSPAVSPSSGIALGPVRRVR